jgi:ParB-like chromosome segregation protein Spo0J
MEPHPYALLLPPLSAEEYEALKTDIAENGIIYPVVVDEAGLILDGVHRARAAGELGIDVPLSHVGQGKPALTDQRKLEIAMGLNMRRRHLDADARRALTRRLSREQGLTVRQIARITGWSKNTAARDLKPTEAERFEALINRGFDLIEEQGEMLGELGGFIEAIGSKTDDEDKGAVSRWMTLTAGEEADPATPAGLTEEEWAAFLEGGRKLFRRWDALRWAWGDLALEVAPQPMTGEELHARLYQFVRAFHERRQAATPPVPLGQEGAGHGTDPQPGAEAAGPGGSPESH